MNLSTKYNEAVTFCQCSDLVNSYDHIIAQFRCDKFKNIAILGETNCGKTTLLNLLAGQEVKAPSKLSLDSTPIMVTYDLNAAKPGFEILHAETANPVRKELSLYEIPINLAIDYQTGRPTPMLAQMDAVIYVISAIMPFSASDAKNLSALVNRFPTALYISKLEMLDNENDQQECKQYIKQEFSYKFPDIPVELFESTDASSVADMLQLFSSLSLEEIRDVHALQIEELCKDSLRAKLETHLKDLEQQRITKRQEAIALETEDQSRQLIWTTLRTEMMEKEQETLDIVNKQLNMAKIESRQVLVELYQKASSKQDWLSNQLKPNLENQLSTHMCTVMSQIKNMMEMHASWAVAEVGQRLNLDLRIESQPQSPERLPSVTGNVPVSPSPVKIILGTGSGILASSVLFSTAALLPTIIVSIPASILAIGLIKGGIDERKAYDYAVEKYIGTCCEHNFTALIKSIHSSIISFYRDVLDQMVILSNSQSSTVDYSSLDQKEAEIRRYLSSLSISV